MRRTAFCLALCAAAFSAAAADEKGSSLSIGIERSTGDYGQAADTTITSVPVTAMVGGRPWQFGLTVPWIRVEGPGNVARDIGRFRAGGASRTESGLGDVIAFATRALGTTADGTAFDLTGKFKFGTASAGSGLGTGENDVHLQLDAYRAAGEFAPFATAGYKVLGDPAGIDLRNVFFVSLGAARRLDEQRSAGLMWFGQQKAVDGGAAQSEVSAFYTRRFGGQWRARFYGLVGLADGSPDFGAGAFLIRAY